MEGNIVIEMTPFIFEDGNTYYFQIVKRDSSNNYHDIYVYEKIREERKNFWGKVKTKEYINKINKNPELVDTSLDTHEIKREIKKILTANKAKHQLKNWDGFVGDIPNDVKVALKRESSLKNILGE
jgi:L-fucose isomerase-like protein